MPSWKRVALGFALFYVLTASALYAGTFAHEYSHYVAHEGWGIAPVQFHDDPGGARDSLVYVESGTVDGRQVHVEQVARTTIVLYDDAILYALTLNLMPVEAYETGTLGATYLHTPSGTEEAYTTAHWTGVMGAPLVTAAALFVAALVWMVFKVTMVNRAMLVAFTAELGNNVHHAAEIGINQTFYGITAEILFGIALLVAFATSHTYQALLRGPTARTTEQGQSPSPIPPGRLRFNRAVRGPPTPGRAARSPGGGAYPFTNK